MSNFPFPYCSTGIVGHISNDKSVSITFPDYKVYDGSSSTAVQNAGVVNALIWNPGLVYGCPQGYGAFLQQTGVCKNADLPAYLQTRMNACPDSATKEGIGLVARSCGLSLTNPTCPGK